MCVWGGGDAAVVGIMLSDLKIYYHTHYNVAVLRYVVVVGAALCGCAGIQGFLFISAFVMIVL